MMSFPLFIETKLTENGYPNFRLDTQKRPSLSGEFGTGFYLNTKSVNCWSSDLISQIQTLKSEWNQNQNHKVIHLEFVDIDSDDDRVWDASLHFYVKNI